MTYWSEFLTIVVAHALAVASPGPDFAIVLKQSLTRGRRAAIWTSLGIGAGIALHVAYSLLGISLVVARSPLAFNILKYAGAAYLAWVGVQALRSRPRDATAHAEDGKDPVGEERAKRSAFALGFLTNALNPKATLFFFALFPLAVSATTPKWVQLGYGLWVIGATAAWFCFVSMVFTRPEVRDRFLRHGHWIDRVLGAVFIGFAASLAFATLR